VADYGRIGDDVKGTGHSYFQVTVLAMLDKLRDALTMLCELYGSIKVMSLEMNAAVVTDVMEVNYLTMLCRLKRFYKASSRFPLTEAFLKKEEENMEKTQEDNTRQEAERRNERTWWTDTHLPNP
jgi:hypothetical protein